MARLGDICYKITDGSHNPPVGVAYSEFLMLSSKNIYDDCITFDDPRYLCREEFEIENKRTQIKAGDILLTIVGTVGRVAVVPEDIKNICLQRSVAVIKPKIDIVLPRFLMYQIQSMKKLLDKEAKGVAQKGIYLKQVENISVKVLGLDIQEKIVSRLDKVNTLIFFRKQQLSKLDELVKSRFIEMFGDESKYQSTPLNESVKEMFIGPFGSSLKNECFVSKENGYCVVYEQKHAIRKTMDVDTRYVDEKKYTELQRFTIQAGDIIVSCRGTIGETFVVPNGAPMGIMHPSIMKIRLKESAYNKVFFNHLLIKVLKQHEAEANGSGIKMAITATELGKELFIVPPMDLQQQFAAFVEQIDKSKFEIQKSLEKLETLKKALMQKYFG